MYEWQETTAQSAAAAETERRGLVAAMLQQLGAGAQAAGGKPAKHRLLQAEEDSYGGYYPGDACLDDAPEDFMVTADMPTVRYRMGASECGSFLTFAPGPHDRARVFCGAGRRRKAQAQAQRPRRRKRRRRRRRYRGRGRQRGVCVACGLVPRGPLLNRNAAGQGGGGAKKPKA